MRIIIKNNILILNFQGNREKMNTLLDPISNRYEGFMANREGHNFPSYFIPENHILTPYKDKCVYVIGIYNHRSIQHEMLHAKYYIDVDYREKIHKEWNSFHPLLQNHLICFLKKLGYSEKVMIDEYQAYRYSEPDNFFGIRF